MDHKKNTGGKASPAIKYSIIIPAYNAANTIRRTINSIEQKLEHYEIIVVENGSTDQTDEAVEVLRQDNDRVKLIHSDKGVSRARNAGIAAASGEWLIFVDADDEWIASEESLDNLTLESADIIICSYFKDKSMITHDFRIMNEVLKDRDLADAYDWMLAKPTLRMTVWAKLYKRRTIVENRIAFDHDLRLSEDADFIIKLLNKCDCAVVSDMPIYRYRTDAPSVVRSVDNTRTEAYLAALDTISKRISSNSESVTDFILAHLNLICVHDIYTRDNKATWKEKNNRTKEVVSDPVVGKAVATLKVRDLRNINRIPAFFFKKNLYSLGGIICCFKSEHNRIKQKNKEQ